MKPRGLRWHEKDGEVVIVPHWGHTFAAALILVCNAIILGALANRPPDGKHEPWYHVVFTVLFGVALVAWLTYPFWGRTRISFKGGIVRVGKTTALTLGELKAFTTAPTDRGVAVFAVKTDGTQLELDVPVANPLTLDQGKSAAAEKKRRNHGQAEADFAAERLTHLLAAARSESRNYRE